MCYGSKLLYQMLMSSRTRSIVLPNPNARAGSMANPELVVGGLNVDRLVSWQLGTSGVQVMPGDARLLYLCVCVCVCTYI